jgi:hypothetical protein
MRDVGPRKPPSAALEPGSDVGEIGDSERADDDHQEPDADTPEPSPDEQLTERFRAFAAEGQREGG